jgi:KRAB domain-containing zinc finger protein
MFYVSKHNSAMAHYTCSLCSFATRHKYSLTRHVQGHMEDKPFLCQLCPFTAAQKEELAAHMYVHTCLWYGCWMCPYDLKIHIGDRHGPICPWYNARRKVYLDMHMRKHQVSRPVTCPLCPFVTARVARMNPSHADVPMAALCW